jgi:bacteriocin-like protein
MEGTITLENNVAIRDDDLLLDLETLTDDELAQVGGGTGIFVL